MEHANEGGRVADLVHERGHVSRSVSGVTKVRYGDRPDFRTLEWGVPACKVASIQIGRGFNLCVAPF